MKAEGSILYQAGAHTVRTGPKGSFLVFREEGTHAVRVATIGANPGFERAKQECDKREGERFTGGRVMSKTAYIVPVASAGFVRVDPESNPIGYGLDDEDGRMVEVQGRTWWKTQEGARVAGLSAGYEVSK